MSRFLSRDSVATPVSAESEPTSEDSDGRAGSRPNAEFDSESESDRNSWMGYGLVVVLVGTLVLGLLRPFYPAASAIAIGSFLGLFGLFVAFLAFRERGRE